MYHIIFFLVSVNLLAEDPGFKPLPNWLFFLIIAFLILSKIVVGKLIKNRVKKEAEEANKEE